MSVRVPLFASHCLSTWGQRMWEYGAIIFTMQIYGSTLLPVSVYGLTINISGLMFGPIIGHIIDKYDRAKVARSALFVQNLSIFLSCMAMYALLRFENLRDDELTKDLIYLAAVIFATIAQLGTTCRDISIEKDWIVVISQNGDPLNYYNSRMRRIDLFSKVISPVLVGVVSTFVSTSIAALMVALWMVLAFGFEFFFLTVLYHRVPALKNPKPPKDEILTSDSSVFEKATASAKKYARSWKIYYKHEVFLASFGYTFLFATVIDLGSQQTSYLRWSGITDAALAVARGVSALIGLFATLTYPSLCNSLFPTYNNFEHNTTQKSSKIWTGKNRLVVYLVPVRFCCTLCCNFGH